MISPGRISDAGRGNRYSCSDLVPGGDSQRLSKAAREVFDVCDRGEIWVYVPTICLVEIVYLQEKDRIPANLKARRSFHPIITTISLIEPTFCGGMGQLTGSPFRVIERTPFCTPFGFFTVIL